MIENRRIAALKEAADPVRVADLLALPGRGARRWCPVCQGDGEGHKTPDLSVRVEGWRCHKCGAHGDGLALIQHAEGLSFPAAVNRLEALLGIARDEAPTAAPARCSSAPRPVTPSAPPALYEAFCAACRDLPDPVFEWLETKAISREVAEAAGLRFCGRELPSLLDDLRDRFGVPTVADAGLEALAHYHARRIGAIVIPYRHHGRTLALKCRPPIGKDEVERRGLRRFLAIGSCPSLLNVDALEQTPGAEALVCEGETDTLAALSAGVLAVGVPGAKAFKRSWVALLRGRRVVLAFDGDKGGDDGAANLARLLEQDGQPRPARLPMPEGMDLCDLLASRRTPTPTPTTTPADDPAGWSLEDLARSAAVLEVTSALLGEPVLFVGDGAHVAPGERRPVFRARELSALSSVEPDALRLVSEIKRTFPGAEVLA